MQSKGLLALVSQRALNGSPKNRVPLPTRLYSAVGTNSSSSIVSPSPSSSFKKSSPPYSRPKPSVPRASFSDLDNKVQNIDLKSWMKPRGGDLQSACIFLYLLLN